ncbi:hypothetical protein L484_024693 [Morus notabilis]|uniref:Pentatricopeptide repeat-containing protein n=1 Tax=Morus notabilis TaxID=981085 RepID=W9R4U8_9ROSA|nr:pentatricopeptide repeat-containing protein At5g64320, mitochondrial [Morus notabilis]EXB68678.1 hypothetical protein L484_024693 [Morus notabilis]
MFWRRNHPVHFPIQIHGFPSLSSNLLKSLSLFFLHSSSSSSLSTISIKPSSVIATNSHTAAVSLSPITSICSLLTNHNRQTANIDHLLKGYEEKLSSTVVLQVLMNYRQLGRIRTLEFFSWAGLQMGFQFDDCVIEFMADFLGRRKLFDDMKCFLLTLASHGGHVSCRACSICIRYLGRQGRVKDALSLFEEMGSRFGCKKPDNHVYNNMLYVLCKRNSSEECLIDLALEVFRRIEIPDTYSYSNIIVGLCKFDRVDTALEVFGEMRSRAGLVPTRTAVNVLVGKLCEFSAKEGGVEKVRVKESTNRRPSTILVPNVGVKKSGAIEPAIRVFWEAHYIGLLPSSFVIVQLLLELCRVGKMDDAVEVLKVVENMKPSCLDESYSIVMKAMCDHRLVEQASRLFWRMLSLGKKPKLSVYNSVISMLCKIGDLDSAQKVYKIMNKNRCVPNSLTYSALIHAYVEARNWEASYDLLMEMLGFGWSPHFHTYDMVVNLLSQAGKMDLFFKLERKLESQSLQKLCKMGRLEDAYEKLKSMMDRGLHPPGHIRDGFEHAFEKRGKRKIAQELLERMEKVDYSDGKK